MELSFVKWILWDDCFHLFQWLSSSYLKTLMLVLLLSVTKKKHSGIKKVGSLVSYGIGEWVRIIYIWVSETLFGLVSSARKKKRKDKLGQSYKKALLWKRL